MNKAAINATIDLINLVSEDSQRGTFNMYDVHYGTAACIAGFAHAASLGLQQIPNSFHQGLLLKDRHAQQFLGLTNEQSSYLFFPEIESYDAVTAADAVKTLEKLRDTGEVDWSHVAKREVEA